MRGTHAEVASAKGWYGNDCQNTSTKDVRANRLRFRLLGVQDRIGWTRLEHARAHEAHRQLSESVAICSHGRSTAHFAIESYEAPFVSGPLLSVLCQLYPVGVVISILAILIQ